MANRGQQIKNHFQYRVWVYVIIALVGWFVADLLYTTTQYRPPAERKVDFELVQGGFMDSEGLDAQVSPQALIDGQAYDPTLEQVAFYAIAYSGDGNEDVYGAQKYVVMVAAQEGDVWILPKVLFHQLHTQGALLALDPFVDAALLDVSGIDLTSCRLPAPSDQVDEEGIPLPPDGQQHLYALPASAMKGLDQFGYRTQDSYAVIMGYSKNPDTSAVVLNSVVQQLKDGAPVKEDAP